MIAKYCEFNATIMYNEKKKWCYMLHVFYHKVKRKNHIFNITHHIL